MPRSSQRRRSARVHRHQLEGLALQTLEAHLAALDVYDVAVRCADQASVRERWLDARAALRERLRTFEDTCDRLGIDTRDTTVERGFVRRTGQDRAAVLEGALDYSRREAAELVAAEAVWHAELDCHLGWSLLGAAAPSLPGPDRLALVGAWQLMQRGVEAGVAEAAQCVRGLWLSSLGVPPPRAAPRRAAPSRKPARRARTWQPVVRVAKPRQGTSFKARVRAGSRHLASQRRAEASTSGRGANDGLGQVATGPALLAASGPASAPQRKPFGGAAWAPSKMVGFRDAPQDLTA